MTEPDLKDTWLWRHAFVDRRRDSKPSEQEFFRTQFLDVRDRTRHLVARIATDMPGMTVHDITHLDALWDTASVVAEGEIEVNPPEAFVFGASVLLHDAAMSLAAYPNGLDDLKETIDWQDIVARFAAERGADFDVHNPPDDVIRDATPIVLRRLHASRAETLAEQAWTDSDGDARHLIENPDVRRFYGQAIGRIAHSHWWPIHRVETELAGNLGSLANTTRNTVDQIKVACLLRIADALHLDSRRAPSFLRAITRPTGVSADHWTFQERLSRPSVRRGAVVFTTGQAFDRPDADSWWLAYDTLGNVDRELHDVDLVLQNTGRARLKASRIEGAGSPESLATHLTTRSWRPVDTTLRASDVPALAETLGGARLYGNDRTVPLRELIQNAADAVRARRQLERRPADWGRIVVELEKRDDGHWLTVEDNGVGMSEQVLTGPLLDFGNSLWRSELAMEEFPGLAAAGMDPIGRFGIGFFASFMLGSHIHVYSRRYDKGHGAGRLLEFAGGLRNRPILAPTPNAPRDGGTRVEILLKNNPSERDGLLNQPFDPFTGARSLSLLVASIAPCLDVAVFASQDGVEHSATQPNDWLSIPGKELAQRLDPDTPTPSDSKALLIREIKEADGTVSGRAWISPSDSLFGNPAGCVATAGLRANPLYNIDGILLGEPVTAARNLALPIVSAQALSRWASEQASLIADTVPDRAYQAHAAEVVLQCDGDIGALSILRDGSTWLNSEEFQAKLRPLDEVVVSFEGPFKYDDHLDEDISPSDFSHSFVPNLAIVVVEKHPRTVVGSSNSDWPRRRSTRPYSNLTEFVTGLIAATWGANVEETIEDHCVGSAFGAPVLRSVSVFRRLSDSED